MNKKISTYLLILIFLLAVCNSEPNEKKSETGIRQVEKKDINISESKKKPIPEIARNLDDTIKIFHNHNFGEEDSDSINIVFMIKWQWYGNKLSYKERIYKCEFNLL